MNFEAVILNIPGLGGSGPLHWQSVWEREFGLVRVVQRDWENPVCDEWTKTINVAVTKAGTPNIILVGHSLGCAAIVAWAEKYGEIIKGALLVAPADTEAEGFPAVTSGFTPMPLHKLPFPSFVIASDDDAYVSVERAKYFSKCWGSELIEMHGLGHINSASKLDTWIKGLDVLKRLDG